MYYLVTRKSKSDDAGEVLHTVSGLRDLAAIINNGKSYIWFSRQLKEKESITINNRVITKFKPKPKRKRK